MDSYGDHALVCPCNGDRTIRHNCIRDIAWEEAKAAGMHAEREKHGLLPARPEEDGIRPVAGDRRPADVWLPQGPERRAAALDFAVTSGLRGDLWRTVPEDPNRVFVQYEEFKKTYKDTAQQCTTVGFTFCPMVLEAHGGAWAPSARRVWDSIARRASSAWNDGQESTSLKLAQRLSCSLHRESARAILRRLDEGDLALPPPAWDLEAQVPLV